MKTMTFQARQLKDALAQVRAKLGPDALILSTRQVPPLLGIGPPLLEVVAAGPAEEAPARTDADAAADGETADVPPLRERPRAGTAPGRAAYPGATMAAAMQAGQQHYQAIARSGAVSRLFQRKGKAPASELRIEEEGEAEAAPPGTAESEAEREAAIAARLQPLHREVQALRSQLYQVAQGATLKQEVEELRQVLRTMSHSAEKNGELTPEAARLINLGFDRQHADSLLLRAREIGGDFKAALRKAVAERVVTAGPVGVSARVAAFVGPTGVGKTTTIAKIAARAALIDGAKVALVTIDTFRVGAIDQLQRYADLMELPLHVAGTSAALKAAVLANAGADLVLVDTAGRGPRDGAQIAALRELLGGGDGIEVHLCLAATTRTREQALALQSYRPLQPSRLCITKLDEALGLGEVLQVHETARLPLSYFGVGQRVPEDLELCTGEGYADRLLGALGGKAGGAG